MTDHLTPTKTDRGFTHLPPVQAHWGGQDTGTVTLCESSAAEGPHLWLHAEAAEGFGTPAERVSMHLPLAEAAKLRDQLDFLIKHHYQGDDPL